MHQERSSRAKPSVSPIVGAVAVFLIVLLLGLVWLRLRGWSGQKVEGSLTTALVNPYNSVDAAGYTTSVEAVRGVQVDASCAQSLEAMLSACESAGCSPVLGAGYLSRSALEGDPAQSLEDDSAGFSEHELGLAVDITDAQTTDAARSPVLAWLAENAWHYGFIQRYPAGSEGSTGVPACPWHFRYVGDAAAEQIHQLGITHEDYVNLFYNDPAAVVFDK